MIAVDVEDLEWAHDGEIVDQFRGALLRWILQRASRARAAHFSNVLKHTWPKESHPDPMESAVGVEVAANRVCVKRCENDAIEFSRDQRQTSIRVVISDGFAKDDEAVL